MWAWFHDNKSGHDNSTSLFELLGWLDELIQVKHFQQCLAPRRYSINVRSYYPTFKIILKIIWKHLISTSSLNSQGPIMNVSFWFSVIRVLYFITEKHLIFNDDFITPVLFTSTWSNRRLFRSSNLAWFPVAQFLLRLVLAWKGVLTRTLVSLANICVSLVYSPDVLS